MTAISGYLGAIAANAPVSLMVPSTITTAPAGITPDAPRRGSVIAYAPLMMMVSVIALHPCNSARPRSRAWASFLRAVRSRVHSASTGRCRCASPAAVISAVAGTFARRSNERNDLDEDQRNRNGGSLEKRCSLTGDQRFESPILRRRVCLSTDFAVAALWPHSRSARITLG